MDAYGPECCPVFEVVFTLLRVLRGTRIAGSQKGCTVVGLFRPEH